MKHFLRKLHLGGNRDEHQATEGAGSQSQHDTSSSFSSGFAEWWTSLTRHNQSPNQSQNQSDQQQNLQHQQGARRGGGGDRDQRAAAHERDQRTAQRSRSQPQDYESLDEEYQVQLAIALSVSNNDQPVDPEIEAVKRISLGLSPTPTTSSSNSQAELAAYRYWAYNVLNYDDRVVDGFYDIYGVVVCEPTYPKKMPSLVDLQGEPVSNVISCEVVLVNRETDNELAKLEKCAAAALAQSGGGAEGPIKSGLAQKLAIMVAEQMGGPVDSEVDMLAVWRTAIWDLRCSFQSNVIPIGYLQIGLARHRALLFKVLADCVGLPCRLVKGRHYTGLDEGAVNIIKDVDNREYIIDLMGAPGALIPPDAPILDGGDKQTDVNLVQRHHSEPVELENALSGYERRSGPSHLRSPSWTEGIGAPTVRQTRAKDISQYMVDAAKENPQLAQKLHDVLLESGVAAPPDFLAELSPKELQQQTKDAAESRKANRGQAAKPKDKGKPPLISKPSTVKVETSARERLQRLKSVEGLGDRRPLEAPPPLGVSTPSVATAVSVLSAVQDNFPADLIKNSPVAASAITAAVVASSMVVAAAKSDNAEGSLEVPITAAATATAAVVAATSAAVVLKSESGSGNSDKDGSGDNRKKQEECSSSGQKIKKHPRGSDDDGSMEDDRDRGGSSSRSESVMEEAAEWEIPWEELVVGERIGLGSYGEVYRGDWRGTEVAIKKFLDQDISGDALDEFITEVRLMRRMRHPNVVLFMGAVTRPPNLSIVTEFLPRGSLYKLLHRPNTQLDERRRLRMALDVAKGMNYLHSSTPVIVHRDLKSPNLLVDKNWVVKVCDFGLSRMKHHTFLSSKSQAGTPEWMAPEVLRNEPSDEKADVYSFGVILWELATLQQPWHGMNPMQVVGAVGFQHRRLDIPADLDPAIVKIIEDCWHNDPKLRPSFAEIMRALRPFQKPIIASQAQRVRPHQPS